MEILAKISMAILIGFIVCVFISPLIIKIAHKIKFNQPVYELVDMHTKKSGTPTFGGIIFLIGITISTLFVSANQNSLTIVSLFVMLGFGIIGFLDDYIKVKHKHNEGLKPYQKLLAQILVATIVTIFAYSNGLINGEILIPFTVKSIDIGILFIPLGIIFFLAITNSVNLTDGLDGLAGGVSLMYFITFLITFFIISNKTILSENSIIGMEYSNIMILIGATIGALLGYLMYNCHPATIFMGDTGSLALGGLIGVVALFTKTMFLVPIIGAMFVASSVSVIMQVTYYKLTKKRIFLMAPLHHHFEKKCMYETKIVAIYIIVTAIVGVLTILLTSIFVK